MSTDNTNQNEKSSEPVVSQELPRREATVMELAAIIAASGDFPDCRKLEKAAVRILAGREMNVGPFASVIGIRIKDGRVSMDAGLMTSCIERSQRYGYRIVEHDDKHCKILFFNKGADGESKPDGAAGVSEFSIEHAKTAGLANKETWKNYPRNMLFARALSNGAKWYCAGIFGGAIYTHEELGIATDEDGRAIEISDAEGNELCTRSQRQDICRLVESAGDSMPGFLARCGIKILDELSRNEANKEIKKLEKKIAKTEDKKPAEPQIESQTIVSENTTPAQQTLIDAYAEANQPSTLEQHKRIIELANKLVPDEKECEEMLIDAMKRRHKEKFRELDFLEANAMIEKLEHTLAAAEELTKEPPFDPTPGKTGN